MRLALLLAFLALPLIELSLLIKTGQMLGFWPTLAIVIGTGLLGSFVLRRQGLGALRRATEAVEAGRPPIEPVIDGVFILLAGAFLVSPGLLTDLLGLLLLIPPVRRSIARLAVGRLLNSASVRVEVFGYGMRRGGRGPATRQRGDVIDGEFERVDDEPGPDEGPSEPRARRLPDRRRP